MAESSAELRALAHTGLRDARSAGPRQANQKRTAARALLNQARRRDLFDLAQHIGSANVTLASFRDYLRQQRHDV